VEMSKVPIFGVLYKTGSVLVDRKSDISRRESFAKMKEVLEMGLHMCIYPEGTRNTSTEPIKPFHDGAFRLSFDSGKPILPALIFNSTKVLPRKFFFFWPAKIELHYLKPVSQKDFPFAEKLKENVFNLMKEYYSSHST
jgi:1-acyl-sn-glycerol-3-phosphate acyltransferase